MKALILAAGYATRLYPLTENTPKPLLMIGPKPMVEHIIDRLKEIPEIDELFVVTNAKFYSTFVEWANNFEAPFPVKIINDGTTSNEDRLGAVGDIAFVIEHEKITDGLISVAGDNLFTFNLGKMFEFFKEKKGSALALYDLKDPALLANKFGVVEIDSDNKVIGFEEKPDNPKTSLTATACYMLTSEDVQELLRCKKEIKPDNLGDFIKWLSAKKNVYGYIPEGEWIDIGGHDELKEVQARYEEK